MLSSILVPTDGSDHANKAVVFAADLAKRYGAKLTLLHVIRGPGSEHVPEELVEYARVEHLAVTERDLLEGAAREILEKAEKQARNHGAAEIQAVIDVGDPARRILHHAAAGKAELIVMGSRGLGDLRSLLLGSVSHKVSHLAPCTCVTVR